MSKDSANPNVQKHAADDIHPAAKPFLFLVDDKFKRNFLWLPLAGIVITTILGVMHPLKHPAPWDIIPGSWAVFGFLAYSFIVFMARPLFKLLSRDEGYYGEGGLPDPFVSAEGHDETSHAETNKAGDKS
ncbi:hypothetical protein [Litorimonas sp.]|mgnify:CR=1 FL=1|uniref:hypothetical protein n=1 Tax=Litorimonas sp. TaxID=1892381 RepID=UPI003A87555E